MPKYKRILLKLSGEAFAGDAGFGIDASRIAEIATELVGVAGLGVQLGIVVGGGNFFRGIRASETGLRRISVDYMGMLATGMNALALQGFIEAQGGRAEVMSAVPMEPLLAPFTQRRALASFEAGSVVIFAAGTGSPFFTTDTAAALRAVEIDAELLAKATKVDGVYDKDPVRFPDATRYEKISYAEFLSDRLEVMDVTAVSLCRESALPIVVFNLNEAGNINKLVMGEEVGTLVS